jgi:hypothetical protein
MKMYVANATKLNVDFLYRVPGQTGLRNQHVPIGGQVALSGDLTGEEIDAIVEQHARYGMVAVDAIDQSVEFSGTCYSIDKPIHMAKIEKLMRHNSEELVKRGRKIRQEAALSSSNSLEANLDDAAGQDAPGVNKFEMSVVEENHDDRDENPAIAEGVRVTRAGGEKTQQRTGKRRR